MTQAGSSVLTLPVLSFYRRQISPYVAKDESNTSNVPVMVVEGGLPSRCSGSVPHLFSRPLFFPFMVTLPHSLFHYLLGLENLSQEMTR